MRRPLLLSLLLPPALVLACTDSQPECSGWAGAGECKNNPAFMLTGCCKSCQDLANGKLPDGVESWEVEDLERPRADSKVVDVDDTRLQVLASRQPECDPSAAAESACPGPPTVITWFYAPWCKQCKIVRAAYEETAKMLAGHTESPAYGAPSSLSFARLDCVKYQDAKKAHEVGAYPSFKVVRGRRERWLEIPRNRSTQVLVRLALWEARGPFRWVRTEAELRAALYEQLDDGVDPVQYHVTGAGEALGVALLSEEDEAAAAAVAGGGGLGGSAAVRAYEELAAGCSVRSSPMPFVALTDRSLLKKLGLPSDMPLNTLGMVKLFSEPSGAPPEEQAAPRMVTTPLLLGSDEQRQQQQQQQQAEEVEDARFERLCGWVKAQRLPLLLDFDADPTWGKRAGAFSFVKVHCVLFLSAPHRELASVVRAAVARVERGTAIVMQLFVSNDEHEIRQNAMMRRYGVNTLLDTPKLIFLDQRVELKEGASRQRPFTSPQITEEAVVDHLLKLGLRLEGDAAPSDDGGVKDEL